jgi:hypothetical protein
MSAHCSKCGSDITYPGDTWPVGTCERCDLEARLEQLEQKLEARVKQLERMLAWYVGDERGRLRTVFAGDPPPDHPYWERVGVLNDIARR